MNVKCPDCNERLKECVSILEHREECPYFIYKQKMKDIRETIETSRLVSNTDKDMINNPSHYTQGGIEPLDFITSNDMSFLEGNVIKYVTRYKHKNGLEDLKKAQVYLNKLIELYK